MPVHFEEYEAANTGTERVIDAESNAYAILAFLAQHPETGYKPKEIHEATDVPRGSVGTTLQRLETRGLLRHKEPYWAIDKDGIAAYEAVLTSLQTAENATAYDWGEDDPENYRIGLDAVTDNQ